MDSEQKSLKKFLVLGSPVHICGDYADWLQQRLLQQLGTHVVTFNAEMAMLARQNPDFAATVKHAELVVPDGSGVVLYARSQGEKIDRCPGIELAESLIKFTAEQKLNVFLIGGNVGVAETVAEQWHQQFPGMAIAGIQHGYFDQTGEKSLIQQLQSSQPHLILVGLGVPRQELWISQYRQICPQATWIGVGGSFDVWAGLKERAPKWLREIHLEWAYRLYQEPWRWRRMLALPQFAWCVTLQSLRGLVKN
jgi:N-acetylglucosaminyldiphosphoundecaprenol N-acetyl-beta-D-mannosaminyltransferase